VNPHTPWQYSSKPLGTFNAYNAGTVGATITQVPIVGGEYYTYFYFDPNNAGAGGNGTITYTPPAGSSTPLSGGLPYLQSVPVTVTN
jgi:hypothetical protein